MDKPTEEKQCLKRLGTAVKNLRTSKRKNPRLREYMHAVQIFDIRDKLPTRSRTINMKGQAGLAA